jgi:hypothetical protein
MEKKGVASVYHPKETIEQQKLIMWVDTFHPEQSKFLFAVPNGGSRHPAEAARLKLEGVRPGVPDLFFYRARGGYHGLFIEMKRRKGSTGVVTGGQRGFIERARQEGYKAVVCWGCEEAKKALTEYWSNTANAAPPEDPIDLLLAIE